MRNKVTQQDIDSVMKLFNRTDTDSEVDGIIDNSDGYIADKLNMPKHRVTTIIRKELIKKESNYGK